MNEYKTCPYEYSRLEYDYALLKLKKNIELPEYNTFLEVSLPCEICTKDKKEELSLDIFGFPYYKSNYKPLDKEAKRMKLNQYGLTRKNRIVVFEPKNFKMGYQISTVVGQGGCPIVTEDRIIGIHIGSGLEKKQYNIGRILTTDLIRNLKLWCKELNGHEFTISTGNICTHLEKNEFLLAEIAASHE
jgi:hypothetical protein